MSEKLVRDNIIAIMKAEGKDPKFRRITGDHQINTYVHQEIVKLVTDKLKEELQEVLTAPTKHHLTEELGDLLSVMQKFAQVNGLHWDDVLAAQHGKDVVKGKFGLNIVLDNVEDHCGKKK